MCRLTGCQRIALEVRFLRHVKVLPNGCHIWTGAQSVGGFQAKGKFKSRGGPYGSFKVGKDADGTFFNSQKAHVVFAFLRGVIPTFRVPAGHHLDHHCDSGTLCVSCVQLVPDTVNLKLRHERPKHENAAAVALDVAKERRARAAKARRRAAARKGRRVSSNPERAHASL